jgi:hypothetical protein
MKQELGVQQLKNYAGQCLANEIRKNLEKEYYEKIFPTFSPLPISKKIRLEKDGWYVMCNPTFDEYTSPTPIKSYYCSEIIE